MNHSQAQALIDSNTAACNACARLVQEVQQTNKLLELILQEVRRQPGKPAGGKCAPWSAVEQGRKRVHGGLSDDNETGAAAGPR